jgi:S-adenosylmethionine:diacylglycerol 3-amino-3-carboxypropyl transferase
METSKTVWIPAVVIGVLISSAGCRPDVKSAAFLSKAAAEVNKKCPMMIDAETEMSRAEGLEGVFVYNYRLVKMAASDVDGAQLQAALQPQVAKLACTTPQTRDTFLKQGITMRYTYADKDHVPIATFDVTAADCK